MPVLRSPTWIVKNAIAMHRAVKGQWDWSWCGDECIPSDDVTMHVSLGMVDHGSR
jgi:hypothetical protein